MNANTVSLVPRRQHGWWMGLATMLVKENLSWWRTRRWWIQCLLWLALSNGTLQLNIRGGTRIQGDALIFLQMLGLFSSIAAISLAQDSILGEKHSGTAAWVLSKPLRRPAFILAKLIAYGFGTLVTGVLIPGMVAYFQITQNGLPGLSLLDFAGAMGLVYLNLIFYLTLALMLATLFHGRGPVLAIGVALLIGTQFIMSSIPWKVANLLKAILPFRLVVDFTGPTPLAGNFVIGVPLPTVVPVIATALWCVLFVGIAIWRFRREEF